MNTHDVLQCLSVLKKQQFSAFVYKLVTLLSFLLDEKDSMFWFGIYFKSESGNKKP